MKVYELAKRQGYETKLVLDKLKAAGLNVKTPVSVIPDNELEKAFDLIPSVKPKVPDSVIEAALKEAHATPVPQFTTETTFKFKTVPAEGLEPRFDQYVVGIRRRVVNGKKVFSLLTYAFDSETLEIKLLKETPQKSEGVAISELNMEMIKRRVN